MQQNLRLTMGSVEGGLVFLPDSLVAKCDTEQAAMRLCMNQSPIHWDYRALAEELSMTAGALNTILNCDHHDRARYMSRSMQINFQRLCGNRALDQWADLYERGMLNCQRDKAETIKALKAQLRELEK